MGVQRQTTSENDTKLLYRKKWLRALKGKPKEPIYMIEKWLNPRGRDLGSRNTEGYANFLKIFIYVFQRESSPGWGEGQREKQTPC